MRPFSCSPPTLQATPATHANMWIQRHVHTYMYAYVCTYTRTYIKHLTQTEATGWRGERKRHANGKKEHREESRSAAQRIFYGVYATWARILKSLIARRFNSSRIRIPLQRNGTSCIHGPTDPFPLFRWPRPFLAPLSRKLILRLYTVQSQLVLRQILKVIRRIQIIFEFYIFRNRLRDSYWNILNRKLQIKASCNRYLNLKNL